MAGTPINLSSFPSVLDIQKTVALNANAILRNLKITQGYRDLSKAMTSMTGGGNVSWCGFASWSSKTIGVFVRDANMSQRGLQAITQSPIYQSTIQQILNILATAGLGGGGPSDNILLQALDDAVANLKEGNADVYGEIGALYSRLISALGNDANLDLTRLAPVVAPYDSRPSEEGGQRLLIQAAENYYRARFEANGSLKAQLILLANAQIGKHEQMRLQRHIDEFLGGSIEQRIVDHYQQKCGGRAPIEAAVGLLAHAAGALARQLWTRFATGLVLHLDFPGNETLHLSLDVPLPRGKALYPLELQNLNNADVIASLRQFNADGPSAVGTGARDWSNLGQRMHYILVLFRSRQLEPILFSDTFSSAQQSDIAAGRMPTAPPPL